MEEQAGKFDETPWASIESMTAAVMEAEEDAYTQSILENPGLLVPLTISRDAMGEKLNELAVARAAGDGVMQYEAARFLAQHCRGGLGQFPAAAKTMRFLEQREQERHYPNGNIHTVYQHLLNALPCSEGPEWNVVSDMDNIGGYTVKQVLRDQDYADSGYDVSDEEGDRRAGVIQARDIANVRAIRQVPRMMALMLTLDLAFRQGNTLDKDCGVRKEIDKVIRDVFPDQPVEELYASRMVNRLKGSVPPNVKTKSSGGGPKAKAPAMGM